MEANLSEFLLCHFAERDKALGLSFPGTQVRLIAWQIQQERQRQIAEGFRNGVLSRARERMSTIINEATNASTERKRQLLIEAMQLEEVVNKVLNG